MNKDEYNKILELFSEPKTRHTSDIYLKKYLLDEDEWRNNWQQLKNTIFRPDFNSLPEIIFKKEFNQIALIGGVVFTESDFHTLQKCMLEIGDKWFVVIENQYIQPRFIMNNDETTTHPLLRFKFPVDITWEELLNGGLVSMELFETSYKEFFVFGDSAQWGKYAANEYWDHSVDPTGTPLEMIGFKPEFSLIFKEYYDQMQNEKERIQKWLPLKHKEFMQIKNDFREIS